MATKTLHFTLGDNAGALLMSIAQEHLIYELSPIKAMKALKESLVGISDELSLRLLTGEAVLTVDDDRVTFILKPRNEEEHKDFPKLNILEWSDKKLREIKSHGKQVDLALEKIGREMGIYHSGEHISFSTMIKKGTLMKYFYYGEDEELREDLLEEIKNNDKIYELSSTVRVVKGFIEKSIATVRVIEWLKLRYGLEVNSMSEMYAKSTFEKINNKFKRVVACNFSDFIKEEEDMKNYVDGCMEVCNLMSSKLEPVAITDNYSAGWLSPKGIYYGLNGEIANMLHSNIAEALRRDGEIPEGEEGENPDRWLEANGWVKIHGPWILYDGYNLHRMDLKNIPLTKIQRELIYVYGQTCHKGVLKFGLEQEAISAARFQMTEPLMLHKLFEF
jgi:hypothetical protein